MTTCHDDIRFASVTRQEALDTVVHYVQQRGHHFICFCEANLYSCAVRDETVRQALNAASMVLADGVSVYYLAGMTGRNVPERIPGPSFLLAACAHGIQHNFRHFFYGGAAGVADQLAEAMRTQYPGIQIVGTYSPPYRPLTTDEEAEVKQRIEGAKTDLLWVGLGGPKQELWMADHLQRIDVPVMLGVGAAFDFHTGNRPWAPPWIRRIGLEWLYRTLTGGGATFRRNIRCLSLMLGVLTRAWFCRFIKRCKNEPSS